MKLLRYGPRGAEKPGLLDAEGKIRDLSGHIADITGAELSPASLKKLAAIDPTSPCRWSRARPATACRWARRQVHRRRPELRRPRQGSRTCRAAARADACSPRPISCLTGPNDDVMIPKGALKTDWEVELGVVIGKRASLRRAKPTPWTTSPATCW
jgi:2,4-diketo-3-deoxy-L-fuconate hydrolase